MLLLLIALAASIAAALWAWDRRAAPTPVALSIAGPAIRYSDLGTLALSLPREHDDIRRLVERVHGSRGGKHQGELGYITSRGGFVNGREALVIARQAGQLLPGPLCGDVLRVDHLVAPDRPRRRLLLPPPPPSPPPPGRRQHRAGRRYVGPAQWMVRTAPSGQLACPADLQRRYRRTLGLAVTALLLAALLQLRLGADSFGQLILATVEPNRPAAFAWLVPTAQLALHALLGIGVAMVLHARGAPLRGPAVAAFAGLVAANLLWVMSFDAGIQGYSMLLVAAMVVLGPLTVALFARIRVNAGLLTGPALIWTGLAAWATLQAYLAGP